jgi:hypothetical protein
MKRSIDFYVTQLGFFYDHGMDNMAWLTRDEVLLTLSPGTPQVELNSYWGWSLQNIERLLALYEHFKDNALLLSAQPDEAAGRHYFFLYDPDNYPLVFSVDRLDYPAGKL